MPDYDKDYMEELVQNNYDISEAYDTLTVTEREKYAAQSSEEMSPAQEMVEIGANRSMDHEVI